MPQFAARSLAMDQVRLTDRFWLQWITALSERGLSAQFEQIVETGRLENFLRVGRGETGGFQGLYFNDSDVYKWIEACAYVLHRAPNDRLRSQVEEAIDAILKAQEPSGYVDTYLQLEYPSMKYRQLHWLHEMYCQGHLIEAAVAVSECLGDDRLLDAAVRLADHLASEFGPGKRDGYCGHEELELALLRLAKRTGNTRHADLGRWMVDQRGKRPSPLEAEIRDRELQAILKSPYPPLAMEGENYSGEYYQDHAPIREHSSVVGHAVRAMYLYIAATEIASEDDEPELLAAMERAWESLTQRRMYVTGGIGPSGHNEGFTFDYDLPNLSAYAETCAAVGLVFWASKLLLATENSEYGDVMERALYNGALAGISLTTDHYFYANPLESRGSHARVPWFGCACCPPNIARMIGRITDFAIASQGNHVAVHLPIGMVANVVLDSGAATLTVSSDYPYSGEFEIRVDCDQAMAFDLFVRLPDWADEVSTELKGATEEASYESGYAVFRRTWQPGDTLKIQLETEPKWLISHPEVLDNVGRTALSFGPLIYCLEKHDLGVHPQHFSADLDVPVVPELSEDLGGIVRLMVEGAVESTDFVDGLYDVADQRTVEARSASFIPYYAWNNRGATSMQIWVREL